jgi:hypothetical protein
MIRYFSVVLIVLFFLQSSFNTLVYIQFKLQQRYIAKELCVYKNDTKNTCKGKCYLKAHLQKDADSDFSFSYLKEKIDLYYSDCYFLDAVFLYHIREICTNMFFMTPIQKCTDIFHPPASLNYELHDSK